MRKIGRVLCKLGIHKWKEQVSNGTLTKIEWNPWELYRSCRRCSITYVSWWDAARKNLIWRRVA